VTGVVDIVKTLTGGAGSGAEAVCLTTLRENVAGLDVFVPIYGGLSVPYANLDNAATTPPFVPVLRAIEQFGHYYSSVHRGTGFKSLLATHVYEECRRVVAGFIGADPSHHTVIFTHNATHALNKLARRLPLAPDDVVLITGMEHHSNILPWRQRGCVVATAAVYPRDGSLDLADLEAKLTHYGGRVKVVSVSGASNVTGSMPPLRRIARLAHRHGAWFVADGAQLVPHRPVQMGDPEDPERIDFLAFSAHKMYAPFGCGILAGPRAAFEDGAPDMVGGGTVYAVTSDAVVWQHPPDREEAGTPNLMGALALARAVRVYESVGMDDMAAHERELTRYCLRRLLAVKGLRLFGATEPEVHQDRLAVLAMEAEGISHGLLAAVLGHEWGIGVRNGCFCAQPYVRALLGLSDSETKTAVEKLAAGDHIAAPGLVRVSLCAYNTREEIDRLAEALRSVIARGPQARYVPAPDRLAYVPEGWSADYDRHVSV
jgi:selenocysteine lyase/cysteine desulfurase